jgi:hypothetical protein
MPLGKLIPYGSSPEMDINPDFARFWSAYPERYRIAKGSARKAWLKLRPNKEVVEQIMTALSRQKQSAKWKAGYVTSPEKYILEERWEDYIDMEPERPEKAARVECDHVPPCANIHWHMVVAARERGEV